MMASLKRGQRGALGPPPLDPAAHATKDAIEEALRSNLHLQGELIARLKKVSDLKAENRRAAVLVSASLVRKWEEEDSRESDRLAFCPLGGKELKKLVGRERQRRERQWYAEKESKWSDEDGSDSSSTQSPLPTVDQMTRRWAYKDDRKWSRRYFVDPDGSVPKANEDAVRKVEDEADVPFLDDTVGEVKRQQVSGKKGSTSCCNTEIDGNEADTPSIESSKLTAQESSEVAEMVRLHNGHPPWDTVAASLGPGRTPWQCFQHHVCRQPDSRPWTPEEDVLLLKYIAAHGPGFLLNPKGSAADTAARLFPDRTVTQITMRVNASLLNPNYKNEAWSDEEERRLALCMRVYRDAESPLARASGHFPDRASKSVYEKWLRSLDPEITYKPFTKSEDRKLLRGIKEMGGPDTCSWVQLARQHFPSRNPRSLKARWIEVASDEDLERKYAKRARKEERK